MATTASSSTSPGGTPAVIQLGSRLPYITSRQGTLTIDGYTQPGSRVNDAAVGSNAVPGVDIRGNGDAPPRRSASTSPARATRCAASPSATSTGASSSTASTPTTTVSSATGSASGGTAPTGRSPATASLLNTGAHDNLVGTPALADRNVIGNWTAAVDAYGPGTDGNVVQQQPALHPARRRHGHLQHGRRPQLRAQERHRGRRRPVREERHRTDLQPGHRDLARLGSGLEGRTRPRSGRSTATASPATGSASGWTAATTRRTAPGINDSSSDNANGINVYDGTNDNVVQRNYVASVYDGIQVMAPNAQRNIVRGNIIGVSPIGPGRAAGAAGASRSAGARASTSSRATPSGTPRWAGSAWSA